MFHIQLCHTPFFLHLFLCFSFLPRPCYNISGLLLEEVDLWGYPVLLFFLLCTCHAASASARRRVRHPSYLTYHSSTHYAALITALLITPQSSQHYPSHLTHHTTCQSHDVVVWQAQYIEPPGEVAARVGAAGPRLAFVWQAQYTAPFGGAAARVVAGWPAWPPAGFRVAGALRRAFWRSCCARDRRLARGWRSYGRRNT